MQCLAIVYTWAAHPLITRAAHVKSKKKSIQTRSNTTVPLTLFEKSLNNTLMSKHRVLSFKPQLRLEWRGQDGQSETEQPDFPAYVIDSDRVFGTHREHRRHGQSWQPQEQGRARGNAIRRGSGCSRSPTRP